jgi:hypothetical protein
MKGLCYNCYQKKNSTRDHSNETDELTEGELVVEQYLIDEGIKYEVQKEIRGLKGDYDRKKRRADFYLNKFDIYVEFLGKWNSGEQFRNEYKEKMRIYATNNIACVYLWPENLGFIKQALNYRIEKELRVKNKRKQLVRFKQYQVDSELNKYIMVFVLLASFLFLWITRTNNTDWMVGVRTSILFLLSVVALILFSGIFLAFVYYFLIIFVKNEKMERKLERFLWG